MSFVAGLEVRMRYGHGCSAGEADKCPDGLADSVQNTRLALQFTRRVCGTTTINRPVISRCSTRAVTSLIWLEQGKRTGSLTTWWRVARGLRVPLGELVSHLDDAATGGENGVAEV